MELIVGGRAQGKLAYALALTGRTEAEVADGLLLGLPIVNHLHRCVRELLQAGRNAEREVLAFAEAHPDCVFVCDEIGCGLVPVDAFEREYRDAVGRVCCALARRAGRVHRVFCGMGTVIQHW